MKLEQLINCSFDRWYELFKHVTFKSEIIPIGDEILSYLRSNSTIILPVSCQRELDAELEQNKDEFDSDEEFGKQEDHDDDDDDDEQSIKHPDFPEFDGRIREALEKFRHKVFIKLNWSAPKDAYWSLNKLHCDRLSDVYILLKSSDFVSHDLNEALGEFSVDQVAASGFKYCLVVKEWISINPSMEFRCFVRNNKLIGISQRDCRSFYQILVDNKTDLFNRIDKFYLDHVYKKFLDESFVFDVCLGKKLVKLVDFNPFDKQTDSLLYSWDELTSPALLESDSNNHEHKINGLEMRLVDTDTGVNSHQYSMYSQPVDLLCMDQLKSKDIESLVSLMKQEVHQESSDDED